MTARIGVLLLTLLVGRSVFAQAPSMSLNDAIEIALQQNKEVQIARLAIDKADAQVDEALGNALPTINVNAQYNRNIQVPIFFVPNFNDPSAGLQAIQAGLDNAYTVGANFQQVLFNSAVFTGIGASRIYADAAREQYRARVATVITEVKRRYYGALAAREFVRIAAATLENASQNYETVDALFKEGLVAEYDQIRAGVAVDNIRPQLTQAKAGYANAKAALLTYLAQDIEADVELTLDGLEDPTAVPNESDAVDQALANNFDIQALELQLQVLDEIVTVNRSTYYPTLTLQGNWQNNGQSNEFSNWLNASTSFVGVRFDFNIFNGTRTIAQVQQAKVDYLTAEQQLQNLRNLVHLQVRTVVNDLASAVERIQAQQSTVEQAQRGFEIARLRYTEGTGNLLEINDAETALARAQVNRLQALLDYHTSRAEFDRVTGQIPAEYLTIQEDN